MKKFANSLTPIVCSPLLSVSTIIYVGAVFGTVPFRSEMYLLGKSVRSWCDGSSDRSFMVDPLSYFLFQPVFHDWCNKGRGMCYPVC